MGTSFPGWWPRQPRTLSGGQSLPDLIQLFWGTGLLVNVGAIDKRAAVRAGAHVPHQPHPRAGIVGIVRSPVIPPADLKRQHESPPGAVLLVREKGLHDLLTLRTSE